MLSALSEWLFDTSGLSPHGFCLLWEPGLIWLYAISDTAIALAYFSIPIALIVVGRKRSDLVYRPLLWLFAAFILLCGTTHWLDLFTLWSPLYGLQGVVKAATAVASVLTAASLWWALPHFLSLPSAEQLREANRALLASQERLAHAQKLESLGQLTGGIAHDFNNVLQVIVGSLDIIERQMKLGRDGDLMRPLAAIRKAADSASRLTNRMLAFSRRQTLAPREIEPDKLILGMEEMLRRTVGPEIRLELQLKDSYLNVTCDPSQLENALLNLAINAHDAMPAGGRLTIATRDRHFDSERPDAEMQPGDYVEIEVADTGVGIRQEAMAKIFEPFFTTKPPGQGTGLGLSQVYGFVKQSGGGVQVDSAVGDGARVRIFLPGHEPRQQPEIADPATLEATGIGAPGFARALVVEDQPDVRAQLAETLSELGCAVIEAEDGVSGLAMVQSSEPFDLLITDVGLPGLNGLQLAEAARAKRPELPVLLITGYAGKATEGLRLSKSVELLRKPFTLDELTARVRELAARMGARPGVTRASTPPL
jgi:signal transduction histidine kinase/CheY-like chemotaxis protein